MDVLYEFGGGYPDPASFPYDGMVEATARMMKEEGDAAMTYGEAQGYRGLRELICHKYERFEGFRAEAENIIVASKATPIPRRDALRRVAPIARAVVWRFLRNGDVMWMALPNTGRRDLDEAGVAAEIFDRRRTAISHPGSQASHELIDEWS